MKEWALSVCRLRNPKSRVIDLPTEETGTQPELFIDEVRNLHQLARDRGISK